jgi:glucose/arabinose dehydrogenase
MKFMFTLAVLLCAQPSWSQSIPDIEVVPIASGFNKPTHITSANDGSGRLFVVEQSGYIRVLDRSPAQRHRIFLTVKNRVNTGIEKGLLSIAFHPDFRNNLRLFINYTTGENNNLFTQISEFKTTPDRSIAKPLSERSVMRFAQPYANHNGGQLAFGLDGYLYIGNGDGGSGNDPNNNAQRLDTLLGKMLRINVNAADAGKRYSVPADNPFVGTPGALPEIYAYGLRNPWRFSFDRSTGLLYAGDVGQNTREEINVIRKGRNYGWRIMEGTICTPGVNPNCTPVGDAPIIDYDRDAGVSVTGGFVYRGNSFPALQGVYLYADFGSGKIWGLRYDGTQLTSHRLLLDNGLSITSFGEDENRELYLTSYDGRVHQVRTR